MILSKWSILLLSLYPTVVLAESAASTANRMLEIARKALNSDKREDFYGFEKRYVGRLGSRVRRENDILLLKLGDGSEKKFEDKAECRNTAESSKCQQYSLLLEAQALNLFIIQKRYYEGGEYILVDSRTGRETTLKSVPVLSPSGKYLLVMIENDPSVGFAIQIWGRFQDEYRMVWFDSPYADGMYTTYTLVQWDNDSFIRLKAKTEYSAVNIKERQFDFRLVRGNWQLVPVR